MNVDGPKHARAWLQLDLDAVRANTRTVLDTAGVPLLAVVKADGYGHGAADVASAALQAGASRLGVATAAEAHRLRAAGVRAPVQVLGSFLDEEIPTLAAAGVSVTLHEHEDLRRARQIACRIGRRVGVHVKVDVGMSRHGVSLPEAVRMLDHAKRNPTLRLEGLMTHLPCATSEDVARTRDQIRDFTRVVQWARSSDMLPSQVHAAASVALFRFPEARFGQVRSGIALVGLDPAGKIAATGAKLQPALSLHARVMRLKHVSAGTAVGYGARWVARRASRLALVGIGYGDGLPYTLTGQRAHVLIHGVRCPVVGSVMMDYLIVDTTHLPCSPASGDVATLVGTQGRQTLRLEEQAYKAGLIPYAFTCGLGTRLERVVQGRGAALRVHRRAA